jgi:hypothetical protein
MDKKLLIAVFCFILCFVIAILLWLTPLPDLYSAVILALGVTIIIYFVLGGIAASDSLKLTQGSQLVIQISGTAVLFILMLLYFNDQLIQIAKQQRIIDPDIKEFIVLTEEGKVLELVEKKSTYQFIGKPIETASSLNIPLTTVIDDDGKILVKPGIVNESKSATIGILFKEDEDLSEDFFEKLRKHNYYHSMLSTLRLQGCNGEICTDKKGSGFPVKIKEDLEVEEGYLKLDVPPEIGDDLQDEIDKKKNKDLRFKLSNSPANSNSKKIPLVLRDIASIRPNNPNVSAVKARINPKDIQKYNSISNNNSKRAYLFFD